MYCLQNKELPLERELQQPIDVLVNVPAPSVLSKEVQIYDKTIKGDCTIFTARQPCLINAVELDGSFRMDTTLFSFMNANEANEIFAEICQKTPAEFREDSIIPAIKLNSLTTLRVSLISLSRIHPEGIKTVMGAIYEIICAKQASFRTITGEMDEWITRNQIQVEKPLLEERKDDFETNLHAIKLLVQSFSSKESLQAREVARAKQAVREKERMEWLDRLISKPKEYSLVFNDDYVKHIDISERFQFYEDDDYNFYAKGIGRFRVEEHLLVFAFHQKKDAEAFQLSLQTTKIYRGYVEITPDNEVLVKGDLNHFKRLTDNSCKFIKIALTVLCKKRPMLQDQIEEFAKEEFSIDLSALRN